MDHRKFNTRGFVSLLTTFCFVVMLLTGLVLYIEPHGRVAYWTNWRLLGLGKDHWDGIHIVVSVVFLVAAGFHTYFNWKQFVRYLKGKATEGARQWRELALAASFVMLSVVGAAGSWYPFAWLLDLNDAAKSAWAKAPADQPPFGHAEMVSLQSLCDKLGLDPSKAKTRLDAAGIQATLDQTVEAVAEQNGVTPREVFRVMQVNNQRASRGSGFGRRGRGRGEPDEPGRPAGEMTEAPDGDAHEHDARAHGAGRGRGLNRPPGGRGSHGGRRSGGALAADSPAARVYNHLAGKGLGKHSIASLCGELGLPVDDGIASLSKQGIKASPAEPIRSVAVAHQMQPAAVLAALCKNGGCK